jgi:hypothetical protein
MKKPHVVPEVVVLRNRKARVVRHPSGALVHEPPERETAAVIGESARSTLPSAKVMA